MRCAQRKRRDVYATHGCTAEEYHDYLCRALSEKPDVLIDDGGDMVHILHEEHPEWAENLRGGCEGNHHRRDPPAQPRGGGQAEFPHVQHQRRGLQASL